MGQTASRSPSPSPSPSPSIRRIDSESTAMTAPQELSIVDSAESNGRDYISDLPNECLSHIFHSLNSGDRNRCSLVCRSWLQVEGQSRYRLSLDARSDLTSSIPYLFSRFDSVTKLTLRCDRLCRSIGDEDLILISSQCKDLTRIKLINCRELTDSGIEDFAKNCKGLKKFSCGSCNFGAQGMNAVFNHCSFLEEISVKRLRGLSDGSPEIGAASSVRYICLKNVRNAQCFAPLIVGSRNLKTLKLFRCSGEWDGLFESISGRVTGLVELHLERVQISDRGVMAISNSSLEILHLVKTPECTNAAIVSIAGRCKLLRKLHIDGWRTNRIGDEGLIAIAKQCPNLQELVLIGVNTTNLSLGLLGNCHKLERLALCGSEKIGDAEISSIAQKCMALKKLCIKGCPVSNHAMEALVGGCPKLVKLKVKKCRGVTTDGAVWLRSFRQSLVVSLDIDVTENIDASVSDGGPPECGADTPLVPNQITDSTDVPTSSRNQLSSSRARLSIFGGRNFAACAFQRWSNGNNSDAI